MGHVDIIGTDRRQELFRTEIIGSLDGTHHHTGQHSRRTYFMDHDMAQFAADDLITPAGMGHDGNLIAHGARRYKHGSFLTDQLGSQFFQFQHGGVITVYIVADHSSIHGIPHLLCGLSDRITADINITHWKNTLL